VSCIPYILIQHNTHSSTSPRLIARACPGNAVAAGTWLTPRCSRWTAAASALLQRRRFACSPNRPCPLPRLCLTA
jgi:hypothetical protein